MAVGPLPSSLRAMSVIDWIVYGMLAVSSFAVMSALAGKDVEDFVYSFKRGGQ